MFSLERFVAEKLPVGDTVPMSDTEAVKQAWRSQIQTVIKFLMHLKFAPEDDFLLFAIS